MVQVTVETTGRLLVGSEIGAALTALEALRPDVIGLNCATGPDRDDRAPALPRAARAHVPLVPARTRACRRSSTATRTTTSRPRRSPTRTSASSPSSASTSSAAAAAPRPSTCARSSSASAARAPVARARPSYEPGCSSIYSPVPFHQELAFLAIGERTNANGSKKFRDAMLEADWDTCVQMAREQVKEGAHVLDVCVDYVGRDGAADMHEIAQPLRHPGARCRSCSTRPSRRCSRPGSSTPAARRSSTRPTSKTARTRAQRFDRVMSLAREYGAAVICLAIDEEGQARTADWKLQICKRIYDLAVERYGIEPTDLIFDMLTFPLGSGPGRPAPRRHRDHRGDPPRQGRAARASSTILGLSNVSFGLKPAIRHVLNSVFLHECREAGLDAAIVHAARIMPMHKIDDHVREVTLDLVYDRRARRLRPAHRAAWRCSRASTPARSSRRTAPAGRSSERLEHRIIDGDRDGLEADLDEQLDVAARALDRQRRAARGHEGRRRALRPRRDAAPVRAPERGDDEGRGRVPRAAHGEGRRRRQGHRRDRHGQGRRPRHRQEPRRHHPHQQRLRGPQHRDQGAAAGLRRQGDGGAAPTRSA